MKAKNYIKFTLINKNDDDLIYNTFVLYVIGLMELITLILLQGEFNTFTVILLVFIGALLCRLAYAKGSSDARKREHHER